MHILHTVRPVVIACGDWPTDRLRPPLDRTKVIFVSVQFAYTFATLLIACLLYTSFNLHLAYLLAILGCCIWNGGSYYIEVFSQVSALPY